MRVGVLGGTGTVGRATVSGLTARGHEAVVLSRRPREAGRHVDVSSGAGLPAAFEGLDTLVDAVNDTRHPRRVLVDGMRRVVDAAGQAGVAQIVSLSVIGAARVARGYYRTKVEQERVVKAGAVPAT